VTVQVADPKDEEEYVPAVVDQVEMLGGFQIVTATLKDTDVEVKARVAHDYAIEVDANIWLNFPPDDIRFFHEEQAVTAA
jgi:glycerol transport system ATP-binding protein